MLICTCSTGLSARLGISEGTQRLILVTTLPQLNNVGVQALQAHVCSKEINVGEQNLDRD